MGFPLSCAPGRQNLTIQFHCAHFYNMYIYEAKKNLQCNVLAAQNKSIKNTFQRNV